MGQAGDTSIRGPMLQGGGSGGETLLEKLGPISIGRGELRAPGAGTVWEVLRSA